MTLISNRKRSYRCRDEFPTFQLFLLGKHQPIVLFFRERNAQNLNGLSDGFSLPIAIVRLAEPIALTSVFPYAWALVKQFHIGSEQDASFYAGFLISAFSLCEAVMGMYWGGVSDRIGRKPVLLLGCLGTTFSMLLVGFSSSIWIALVGRAIGGLLNGNIGVIQTMVAEVVTNPRHERKYGQREESREPKVRAADFWRTAWAYSVMPFVWSIGTIIGPTIGGTFAQPHESFPSVFPDSSIFTKFPFLLPNLICACLLLFNIVLGYFLLEETHPDINRVMPPEETPLSQSSDAVKRPSVDLWANNYETFKGRCESCLTRPVSDMEKSAKSIFSSNKVMALIISLCIFTYHSMSYDHLLPIFFEDKRAPRFTSSAHIGPFYSPGGLGLSVRDFGAIMAVNGIIALFIQAVIFPVAAERIGIFRIFLVVTTLHPIAYLVVPFLLYVPESVLYPAIYFCLSVRNILSILLYPVLLILLKDATPSSDVLGKVNGLAASAGAACRMIAPPIAGYLYTLGSRLDCTAIAWYGSALIAIIGAIQCFSVKRDKHEDSPDEEGLGEDD